jgi:hypothetical protein
MNQRSPSASTAEFFNKIGQKQPSTMQLFDSVTADSPDVNGRS